MHSPYRVPPPRRASTQGQLLDELEALSQALYQAQAQQKSFGEAPRDVRTPVREKGTSPAPSKKPVTRRESLPARRFSSYEPGKDVQSAGLPGFTSPSPAHPGNRHSISTPQIPDTKPSPVQKSRVATSVTLPSQASPLWADDRTDIRSRFDRRGSPQVQPSGTQFRADDLDWADDSPDIAPRLESSSGDKKKSFWNWKPIRAISHIGRQRFFCVFSAYVHAIRGLPPGMNGLRLAVHIRKEETKEGSVQSIPSRVFQGVAEFEETLYMKCTVYGSKGSQSNTIKFLPKMFIISIVATDVVEIDHLGKHQIDLSRLLPENTDDRKGDLERGNSWNTTLELCGKAKGGKLVMTFNYEVLDKDFAKSSGLASKLQGGLSRRRSSMQTSYSLPSSAHGTPRTRTANPYGNISPTVSEPGNDFGGDLGMEVLDLDDPLDGAIEVKTAPQVELQYYPSIDSQLGMPADSPAGTHNAFDTFEPRLAGNLSRDIGDAELDDYTSDNEQEFTVVDQGMEIDESVKIFQREEEIPPEHESIQTKTVQEQVKYVDETGRQPIQMHVEEEVEKEEVLEQNSTMESSQEGERKEPVTYQMVMKTLESLLQGTSAKERAQLAFLEGQRKLDLSKSTRANFSNQVKEAVLQGQSKGGSSSEMNEFKERIRGQKLQVMDENLDQEVDQFLDMLESGETLLGQNSDNEPESPRAQLLRKFEQEAVLDGSFGLDLSPSREITSPAVAVSDGLLRSAGAKPGATSSLTKITDRVPDTLSTAQGNYSKAKGGKEKPVVEVEQEQGWKDQSLPISTPKELHPEPLGKGLGTSVTVKDGGQLRSMNPVLFLSENCSGKLLMQVSKPVVLPAEMGSGTVDVLRNMASIGIENMALQAMTAMPLEELMGASIDQIAMEGLAFGKASRIRGALGTLRNRPIMKAAAKAVEQLQSDNKDAYVSLENLALIAMQQLEFLAIDGLKIQACMTDEEAPYALNAFTMDGQGSGNEASVAGSLRGVTGVHLLKGAKVPAQTSGGGKGLMDMAITLDEWMLLDGGSLSEAENSKDALAIMAAHRAVQDAERQMLDPKIKGPQWGCMGNMLSIAMLLLLRDPFRSYEPIGVPMIAFVQAERVMVPLLLKRSGEAEQHLSEPLFKITGIHLAGVKSSQENRRPGWGSQRQLRAATRWLLANGMSKPKGASISRAKLRQGDSLWSISAQLLGSGNRWKDLQKRNPLVRNPDVLCGVRV